MLLASVIQSNQLFLLGHITPVLQGLFRDEGKKDDFQVYHYQVQDFGVLHTPAASSARAASPVSVLRSDRQTWRHPVARSLAAAHLGSGTQQPVGEGLAQPLARPGDDGNLPLRWAMCCCVHTTCPGLPLTMYLPNNELIELGILVQPRL